MSDVWTSGSSEGESCDVERTFAWCDTGKLLSNTEIANKEYWTEVPDGKSSAERCIALHFDAKLAKVVLKEADCLGENSFICQA